jgi:hypothetical protein
MFDAQVFAASFGDDQRAAQGEEIRTQSQSGKQASGIEQGVTIELVTDDRPAGSRIAKGKEPPTLAARELKKKSPPRPVYAAATFEQESNQIVLVRLPSPNSSRRGSSWPKYYPTVKVLPEIKGGTAKRFGAIPSQPVFAPVPGFVFSAGSCTLPRDRRRENT